MLQDESFHESSNLLRNSLTFENMTHRKIRKTDDISTGQFPGPHCFSAKLGKEDQSEGILGLVILAVLVLTFQVILTVNDASQCTLTGNQRVQ